jgi:tetratricopeptide (TPR) repeat protein
VICPSDVICIAVCHRLEILIFIFKLTSTTICDRDRSRSKSSSWGQSIPLPHNLAGLYYSQGRYGEAEPLYRRALQITEQQLGADHPHTALSLHNLAGLYYQMNRVAEAKPLITRAVEIFDRTLGNDHPDTVNARQWWQAIHNIEQSSG